MQQMVRAVEKKLERMRKTILEFKKQVGGEYRQKFVIKPEPAVVGATEVLKFAAASMPPPPPPSGRRRKTACEYLL